MVCAVEADNEAVEALTRFVSERRLDNVRVLLAPFDDPALPDGEIDLVFLSNTYHHIENRPEYFRRVQSDLTDSSRVAILEPNEDAPAPISLFTADGRTRSAPDVRGEMGEAGYQRSATYDFLASQIFEVSRPEQP